MPYRDDEAWVPAQTDEEAQAECEALHEMELNHEAELDREAETHYGVRWRWFLGQGDAA